MKHLLFALALSLATAAFSQTSNPRVSKEDSLAIVNAVMQEILMKKQSRQQIQIDSLKVVILELEYQILVEKSKQKHSEYRATIAAQDAQTKANQGEEFSSQSKPVQLTVGKDPNSALLHEIKLLSHQLDSVQSLLLKARPQKD